MEIGNVYREPCPGRCANDANLTCKKKCQKTTCPKLTQNLSKTYLGLKLPKTYPKLTQHLSKTYPKLTPKFRAARNLTCNFVRNLRRGIDFTVQPCAPALQGLRKSVPPRRCGEHLIIVLYLLPWTLSRLQNPDNIWTSFGQVLDNILTNFAILTVHLDGRPNSG